jgi:hypothetical protein
MSPTPSSTRVLVRIIGGLAGIVGGLLTVLLSANQQAVVLDAPGTTAASLWAFALLATSVLTLVRELASTRPVASIVLLVILGLTGFIGVLGFYSLLSAGEIIGIGYAAVGVVAWLVVAPIVAVLVARDGAVHSSPALALALTTVLVFVSGALRVSTITFFVFVAYGIAWIWLGSALLIARLRAHP